MDFLGLGIPELVVIIILALIFIGPRDLPRMAGRFAKLLRDIRMMSEGFTTEWRREINTLSRVEGLEELRDELVATRQALQEAGQEIKGAMEITHDDLDPDTSEAQEPAEKAPPAATIAELNPPDTVPSVNGPGAGTKDGTDQQPDAVPHGQEMSDGATTTATSDDEQPPSDPDVPATPPVEAEADQPNGQPAKPATDIEEISNRG